LTSAVSSQLIVRQQISLGARFFAPLVENGPMQTVVIPWAGRRHYLRLALAYPWQCKTWTVLYPMLVYAYCINGRQKTQGVSLDRLTARPHPGVAVQFVFLATFYTAML
jgi:hypothetical protein